MTVLICNSGIINLKAQLIHCLYISWWPRTSICPVNGWPELSSYVCPGRSDFISLFSLGNVFKPTLGWENEYLLSNSKAVIVLSKQEWWNQKGENKQTNNSKLGTWLQLQCEFSPKMRYTSFRSASRIFCSFVCLLPAVKLCKSLRVQRKELGFFSPQHEVFFVCLLSAPWLILPCWPCFSKWRTWKGSYVQNS